MANRERTEIVSSIHVSQVQNRCSATLSVRGLPRDLTQLAGPIAKHIEPFGLRSGGHVFSKGSGGEGSGNMWLGGFPKSGSSKISPWFNQNGSV